MAQLFFEASSGLDFCKIQRRIKCCELRIVDREYHLSVNTVEAFVPSSLIFKHHTSCLFSSAAENAVEILPLLYQSGVRDRYGWSNRYWSTTSYFPGGKR